MKHILVLLAFVASVFSTTVAQENNGGSNEGPQQIILIPLEGSVTNGHPRSLLPPFVTGEYFDGTLSLYIDEWLLPASVIIEKTDTGIVYSSNVTVPDFTVNISLPEGNYEIQVIYNGIEYIGYLCLI